MNNEEIKEEVKDEGEQLAPAFKFEPKENHDWRQQSVFLVCKSCEIQHAVYIGMDKLLIGLDTEGKPIFKKR